MRPLLLAAAVALIPFSAHADPKTVVDGAIGSFIDAMHMASEATFAKLDPKANEYVWGPVFGGICTALTWRYAQHGMDSGYTVSVDCKTASGKVTAP